MPVKTLFATPSLVLSEVSDEPMPSFTILPLSAQQFWKVSRRPGGRQRSARPEKISISPRQFPSASTGPSLATPGSSTTGSVTIGLAAVSIQATGEQVGVPPALGTAQA